MKRLIAVAASAALCGCATQIDFAEDLFDEEVAVQCADVNLYSQAHGACQIGTIDEDKFDIARGPFRYLKIRRLIR